MSALPPPRATRSRLVGRDGLTSTSSGLAITPGCGLQEVRDAARHADRRRRQGHGGPRPTRSSSPGSRAPLRPPGGRPRSAPAPSCSAGAGPARRPARHHPLGLCRRSSPRRTPQVEVDPDPIFVRDGSIWTSAGVTAGMDLALALVEEDLDRELALTIARHLVLFLRRPGQASRSSAPRSAAQQPEREPLREIQRSVLEDVAGEHTVEAMAARAHMSPRHFARAFRAETGVTPARYVERVRLEAARRLPRGNRASRSPRSRRLRLRHAPRRCAACSCGSLEVGPAEYRRRFQTAHGGEGRGSMPPRKDANEGRSMNIAIVLYDRLHGPRRDRALRGPQPPPGREPALRRAPSRDRCSTDNGMLTLLAEHSPRRCSSARTSCSSRVAPARSPRAPASRCSSGSAGAHETSTWTTSVCTGSLILAAAGLLEGKRATTPLAGPRAAAELGAEPVAGARRLRRQARDRARVSRPGSTWRSRWPARIAGRAGRAGDPAGHRVRPAAALRRRLAAARRRPRSWSCCAPAQPPPGRRRAQTLPARREPLDGRGSARRGSAAGPAANLRFRMAEHRYDPHEIEPPLAGAVGARAHLGGDQRRAAEARCARARRGCAGREAPTPTCSRCSPTRAASRTSAI